MHNTATIATTDLFAGAFPDEAAFRWWVLQAFAF